MIPTKSWRTSYRNNQDKIVCNEDLSTYFTADLLYGKRMDILSLGTVSLVSGQIIVADPLCNLDEETEPFYHKVLPGDYEVEASVVMPEQGDCARYAAVRVQFSKEPAVRYVEALIGDEELEELEPGEIYGFRVDSGLACICDEVTRDAFENFTKEWCERGEQEPENLYNEYFADLFLDSYEKNPKYQREEGDYLDWIIPNTPFHMILFESGFGDGVYPVYYGFDANGQICQMVIQLIDLSIQYQ